MFTHNYLEFDEFGIKFVKCMACSKNIKSRSEIKSTQHPGFVIRELAKHPEYREIPVILDDGKLIFIMVCDECKFVPIEEEDAKLISNQLKEAIKSQLLHEGKMAGLVNEILKTKNYNVLRKAEVSEVTAALRG